MTTDYTLKPLAYRIRKVVRYVRLYGPLRTLEKVRGQYHMKRQGNPLERDWINPKAPNVGHSNVALIGCGNFAFSHIAYYCDKIRRGSIRCAYDPVGARAISIIKRYGGNYAAANALNVISDPAVKTVFIASNHASHAVYAVEALKRGKVVHIEKPHVVSREQLDNLIEAAVAHRGSKIFLGFNRPRSEHFRRLMRTLHDEDGPATINWFIAGHALEPDHWYFSEAEGGRILGNVCHWTDLTLRMVGLENAFPIDIRGLKPSGSESDFAITMMFGDGSVGTISFSAKGHTFEGVREYLNAHKGDALVSMRDFHDLTTHVGHHKNNFTSFFRDHGHRATIEATLAGAKPEALEMIAESARLFLSVRESVDTGMPVRLERCSLART